MKQLRRNIRYRIKTRFIYPVPSAYLRVQAIATANLENYIETGRRNAEGLLRILNRFSINPSDFQNVLDFGCGAGRIIRHLSGRMAPEGKLWGADCNHAAIRWCRRSLPVAGFLSNSRLPPLPFPDHFFDFIFASSVFTHFTLEAETLWIREMARIIKSDGILLITHRGESYASGLKAEERKQYIEKGLVVRRGKRSGRNECDSYPTARHVREAFQPFFRILEHSISPEDFQVRRFYSTSDPGQDVWMFNRNQVDQ